MPVDAKPLFRPDVLRSHLDAFTLPECVEPLRGQLDDWAGLLASGRANKFKEQELLPDFLTLYFHGVLGYTGPADNPDRYTISREHHVEVDGKFADAVLGEFKFKGVPRYAVALEGKGPKDPLDRPFAGRRMSAVDQGYRYAINLPCDWIIVTSIRQIRLYAKGCDQHTYELFDIERLADDENHLKRFVFLLGAESVVPPDGPCHLATLLDEVRVSRLIEIARAQQATRHAILDWLRVEYEIEKPAWKLKAPIDLDSDTFVAAIKKVRGKKKPLTAAGLKGLRDEYARSLEPARKLAAEALKLEHEISDLVNEAYGLTPDEIALTWQTAPPRMPIAKPGSGGST